MAVLLRDVQESDLPVFFEHQRDPVACRMVGFTPRDRPAFMAHWRKLLDDPAVTKKSILLDDRVVGNVLSFERSGKREVGYWIGRDHWGRGVGTEALLRFLDHEQKRPLHAVVAKHNAASIRVLEKCGFKTVGEARGSPGSRGPAVDEFVMELYAGP